MRRLRPSTRTRISVTRPLPTTWASTTSQPASWQLSPRNREDRLQARVLPGRWHPRADQGLSDDPEYGVWECVGSSDVAGSSHLEQSLKEAPDLGNGSPRAAVIQSPHSLFNLREAVFLAGRLAATEMSRGGMIVNRVHSHGLDGLRTHRAGMRARRSNVAALSGQAASR